MSAKDSYFAVESTPADRPAREYYGVMGIGTTATTTLIRVNAALLFASRYLVACGFEDKVVDNFWTITGYFNSLRELGGASTQILDDVQSRFNYLAKTKFSALSPKVDLSESYDHLVELTSRMNNSEITKIIQDRLKRGYRNGQHKDVYDYVLENGWLKIRRNYVPMSHEMLVNERIGSGIDLKKVSYLRLNKDTNSISIRGYLTLTTVYADEEQIEYIYHLIKQECVNLKGEK